MAKVNSDKRKILIVDDDSEIRNHLRISLIHCGFKNIINASNAAEGISLFRNKSPDVTFLDINLPDKDGLAVLGELLSLNKEAYVVMLSGESTFGNVKQSLDSGAKGFIVKPFRMKKIIESLSSLDT
jgi:two-component system chemotaxis response regulator CheY